MSWTEETSLDESHKLRSKTETKTSTKGVTRPEKAEAQLFNLVTHPQFQLSIVENLGSRLTMWKTKFNGQEKKPVETGEIKFKIYWKIWI